MVKPYFISATLVPAFYFIIGVIFTFVPEIPSADLKLPHEKIKIPLLFTQEIGVFFIIFSILFRQIYNISIEVYLLMNNTFKIVLLLSALISPYLYYYTKAPQLCIIFGINIFFIALLQYEKVQAKK
ncbi:MAG: hypothetical protein P8L19_03285 [Flavobacteriales bacterium]|nr:hypothetical protein [Flavobacteriales bacterium]